VTNTVAPDTTNWCLSLPTITKVKNTVPGVPSPVSATRRVDHTVDAVNCRDNTETLEPTDAFLKVVKTLGYDTCGNLNSVSVVGLDKTGAAMPARATSSSFATRCTFAESVTNALGQTATIGYNYSFGVKASTTDANNISVSWLYDNFARKKRESRPDGTYSTWDYTDCITAPAGAMRTCGCMWSTITTMLRRRSDLTNSTSYSSTDHLGSGDLIMDSAGGDLARESFTPFGARRGSNWAGAPPTADYNTYSQTTRRGSTGHEMLDALSLIHMNGRVYDPQLGRFLSADPIVQTISFSQALNPFSYVMNNPLSLVDPSGYSWLSRIFRAIGGIFKKWGSLIISVAFAVVGLPFAGALISSAFNWAVNGGTLASFAIGLIVSGAAGAIATPIGGMLGNLAKIPTEGLLGAILRGAIVGAIAGGISSMMGGSFWSGFVGGAITGGIAAGDVLKMRLRSGCRT
jgi:RHS repeat-associated protein